MSRGVEPPGLFTDDDDDDVTAERARLGKLFAVADDNIDAGCDVLPALVWPKADGTLGKAPALPHGHLEAHRDRQLIRQQLVDPHIPPGVPANREVVVGVVAGSGNYGVLDCDVKHGKAGQESINALLAEHGNFATAAWRTPSGGANILVRKPAGASYGNSSPWPGIDVRADSGWVVAPGNVCTWGAWAWIDGHGYGTASPLPPAMAEQLKTPAQPGRKASWAETVAFIEASPTESSLPAMQAFAAELEQFRDAGRGSRHDALGHILGWAFGMHALDLRWVMDEVKTEWQQLTKGEGRGDEVDDYACWVAGHERDKRAAQDPPSDVTADGWRILILDGATWLHSGSAAVETLWGDQVDALVPRRQPTLIVGETGAGKTTLVQHLILGAAGVPAFADVLGWPVQALTEGERVLYLASDRPDQARIAMLRHFNPIDPEPWQLAQERLRVWQGPPPASLARQPGLLLEMAEAAGAGLVVIDSAKDMAIPLSDDAVGAAVNLAHQMVVASGRDMLVLHHPRKRGREHAADRPTLDDVFGSAWIVNGSGSVLFLIEEPNSTEVLQLKTPNGRQSNFRFRIDPATGALGAAQDDISAAVAAAGAAGISTKQIAVAVTGVPDPTPAQIERVRRHLRVLEATGVVAAIGTGRTALWIAP